MEACPGWDNVGGLSGLLVWLLTSTLLIFYPNLVLLEQKQPDIGYLVDPASSICLS
jgi:hypothetical protein